MNFRRASGSDLPAIVALLADDPLGAGREGDPLDRCYVMAFAAIDADPNQLLAVAENGGVLVGCLQLSFIPGLSRGGMLRGQIEAVRVAASRRGEGVGGKCSPGLSSDAGNAIAAWCSSPRTRPGARRFVSMKPWDLLPATKA